MPADSSIRSPLAFELSVGAIGILEDGSHGAFQQVASCHRHERSRLSVGENSKSNQSVVQVAVRLTSSSENEGGNTRDATRNQNTPERISPCPGTLKS